MATRAEHARRQGRSSSWIRRSTRWAIYARDRFCCVLCGYSAGVPSEQRTLDHVVPRCYGGSNEPSNLITAHRSCNFSRQDRPLTPAQKLRARNATRRKPNREAGRSLASVAKRYRILLT